MARDTEQPAAGPSVLDTGRIEQVPFAQLAVSPFNARKDAEVGAGDELVKSIAAHGLLQPLIGYIAKSGLATVLICAGQRRLLAMAHIAEADTPIPVRIVDEETAIEVSLAENLERKSMNPVDELLAFKALLNTGHYDANRIADRFGYDRRYVRQRLKMAGLAAELLDALREGTIGIAAAEAYAASEEHDMQRAVFKEQCRPNTWNAHSPTVIVQSYAGAGIPADVGLGKFIGGADAYVAEGGKVEIDADFADLFKQHAGTVRTKLADPAIVHRLYERAQAATAAKVEKLAKKAIPFATRVEWCDAKGSPPKQKKGSELTVLREAWDGQRGEYLDAKRIRKIAEKVAAAGGEVVALARVNHDGEPEIADGMLLVSKAQLAKVAPEKKADSAASVAAAQAKVEADRRRYQIASCAANLYARTLLGDTPGFVITMCRPHWQGGLEIELRQATEEKVSHEEFNALVKPFLDAAEKQVDEAAAEAAGP